MDASRERKNLDLLIKILNSIFGERLKSVVLYGSYARGDYVKGISDINVLVVAENLEPEDFLSFRRKFPGSTFRMNIKPVFFTLLFLKKSCDVFPLQWYEIKKYGVILFGTDIRDEISVSKDDIRVQLEKEIKQQYLNFQQDLIFEKDIRSVIELAYWRIKVIQRGLSYLYPEKNFGSSHIDKIKEIIYRKGLFNTDRHLFNELLMDHFIYLQNMVFSIDRVGTTG